jgi:hypothetical protein
MRERFRDGIALGFFLHPIISDCGGGIQSLLDIPGLEDLTDSLRLIGPYPAKQSACNSCSTETWRPVFHRRTGPAEELPWNCLPEAKPLQRPVQL